MNRSDYEDKFQYSPIKVHICKFCAYSYHKKGDVLYCFYCKEMESKGVTDSVVNPDYHCNSWAWLKPINEIK